MKATKYKVLILSAFAITVIGFAAVRHRGHASTEKIEVVHPTIIDLSHRILATGSVQSQNRIEIRPPAAGRIDSILASEGSKVKQDQILGWMSSSERVSLLDAARAKGPEEYNRWKELYRATPIIAPLDGTLILSNVKPGQTVAASDVVFVVSDRLIVRANVDETDIAVIAPGLAAEITLDAYPSKVIEAKVGRIAFDAKTTNNVTTYEIDVIPLSVPHFMKSGMTANVNFVVDSRQNVLAVPSDSILLEEEEAYVRVMSAKDDKHPVAEKRKISVGLSDGKMTEVVAGLSPEDSIVLSGWTGPEKVSQSVNPFMPAMKSAKKGGKVGQ